MQPFEYANPTTIQEAVGQLGSQWGEADVLAGGTDLISLMKEYLVTPKRLVNIKNIKELGGIQDSKNGLRIGATVTIETLDDRSGLVDLWASGEHVGPLPARIEPKAGALAVMVPAPAPAPAT